MYAFGCLKVHMHDSNLTPRFWSSEGPIQLRLLAGGGPEEVARKVDGTGGPAAREIHH